MVISFDPPEGDRARGPLVQWKPFGYRILFVGVALASAECLRFLTPSVAVLFGMLVALALECALQAKYRVTARRTAPQQSNPPECRAFMDKLTRSIPGLLSVYDLHQGHSVYTNRQLVELLGYEDPDLKLTPKAILPLLHPDDRGRFQEHQALLLQLSEGETAQIAYRVLKANGQWCWLSSIDSVFSRDQAGIPAQIVGLTRDVTTEQARLEIVEHDALCDPLTGVWNRRRLESELNLQVAEALSGGHALTLCMCDLDHFKLVNDTLGHAVGDRVLLLFARTLQSSVRGGDLVARIGGDEFCLVLPRADTREAELVVRRISERFKKAVRYEFGVLTSSSFGLAALRTGQTPAQLVAEADRDLYERKAASRTPELSQPVTTLPRSALSLVPTILPTSGRTTQKSHDQRR